MRMQLTARCNGQFLLFKKEKLFHRSVTIASVRSEIKAIKWFSKQCLRNPERASSRGINSSPWIKITRKALNQLGHTNLRFNL